MRLAVLVGASVTVALSIAVVLLVVVAWWYQLDCSSRCDENIREVIGDALGVAESVRNSALGVALNATNLLGTALTASLSSATAASIDSRLRQFGSVALVTADLLHRRHAALFPTKSGPAGRGIDTFAEISAVQPTAHLPRVVFGARRMPGSTIFCSNITKAPHPLPSWCRPRSPLSLTQPLPWFRLR